ncbi:MAG TPA: CHAT domain-containing protein [Pyrinomonadaceae bacterium]|nr:CHAT domain-containing protein [Pyrinomonadaceae bacterium]
MAILAQFFCGRDEGHVFIADAKGGDPSITGFPLEPVVSETLDYFKGILEGGESEAGEALRSLVEPIVEHSAEDEVVWIVPHNILHYLPFHALPTKEGFLGFRNPVCYTPSASTLPVCRRGPRLDGKPVISIGDPTQDLRYARLEAERVAEAFNGESLLERKATKQRLFAELEKHEAVDILHLACHGQAGADDASQSGVFLAPDRISQNNEPDMLTAGEIVRHRLHAALVTISACNAGFGAVEASDEVLGLTRSLLYAGASSVLLSYWPLDDFSTYLIIERSYEELRRMIAEGAGNKANAVRAGQRYVHDLTIKDLVARCDVSAEQCAARSDIHGQLDLLIEGAEWVTMAGDLQEALQRYHNIQNLIDASPAAFAGQTDSIQDQIEQVELQILLGGEPIDYSAHPFSEERHWAGFFLHGDWRL